MTAKIVFYDLPSAHPNKSWSPNTLKTRYALNYKGLPYETKWIEYPDVEALCKDIGGPPLRNKPDGRPHYTLPTIQDPSTGAVITDSTKIAAYLDRTYPDAPKLMPAGFGLFRAFEDAMQPLLSPLYPFCLPASNRILNPRSEEYFRRTREASLGKKMEEMAPTGEAEVEAWGRVKESFAKIEEWIRANGEESVYFMGDTVCYADMWVASYALWIKLVLPEKWEDVRTWHSGRWERLLDSLKKYETVM